MRRLVVLLLLLLAFAGCDDDDDDAAAPERQELGKVVDGTFVGRLSGTGALLAVTAAPPQKGGRRRDVAVFACDAAEICEWLVGRADGNRFSAASTDGDARATGTLTRKRAAGRIELAGGETAEYSARRATAATGLYTLTVSADGRLQGASAGGVGVSGRSALPEPGPGTLRLADGTRLRFRAARAGEGSRLTLKRGEARIIVLADGRMRGAGASFYLRSRR